MKHNLLIFGLVGLVCLMVPSRNAGATISLPIQNGVLQTPLNANNQDITNARTITVSNVTMQSFTWGGIVYSNVAQLGGGGGIAWQQLTGIPIVNGNLSVLNPTSNVATITLYGQTNGGYSRTISGTPSGIIIESVQIAAGVVSANSYTGSGLGLSGIPTFSSIATNLWVGTNSFAQLNPNNLTVWGAGTTSANSTAYVNDGNGRLTNVINGDYFTNNTGSSKTLLNTAAGSTLYSWNIGAVHNQFGTVVNGASPAPLAAYGLLMDFAANGVLPTNIPGASITGAVPSATHAALADGATTAKTLSGGFDTYIVKTNGWYSPSGAWHDETNSGQSYQNALNDSALYNPVDAYTYIDQTDYGQPNQIINLPYGVGGTFLLEPSGQGGYCKPDGSAFIISNNIATGRWKTVGIGWNAPLVANSNIVDCAIHYLRNNWAACYQIEFDDVMFMSKSNAMNLQVNLGLGSQSSIVRDCIFTMYDYMLVASNTIPFEHPNGIKQPAGMIGLQLGGDLGRGEATGNKFFGLACGMMCLESDTYVKGNQFWEIKTPNLWSSSDVRDISVGSRSLVLIGSEIALGAALIVNGSGQEYYEQNFFFESDVGIYIGEQAPNGLRIIKDNHFINATTDILVSPTNLLTHGSWDNTKFFHNYDNSSGEILSVVGIAWNTPYSLTNLALIGFTNSAINHPYLLKTNSGDISITQLGFAIWTNAANTNWTIKLNDSNVADAGLVIESNNVEIYPPNDSPCLDTYPTYSDYFDSTFTFHVAGTISLGPIPIPASRTAISYVETITHGVTVQGGNLTTTGGENATSFTGSTYWLPTNAASAWPAAAQTPGAQALVNSNGTSYILKSGPASTVWTSTNKLF